jgi:hypothetical protein
MKYHDAVWGIVALRIEEQKRPLTKKEQRYLNKCLKKCKKSK